MPDSRGMLQLQAVDVLTFRSVEVIPVEYQEYVDALQRHRAGRPTWYGECTLSHAVSRGVVTPGGICRPDSRGMLQLPVAQIVVWNADAKPSAVTFNSVTRQINRKQRRHASAHRAHLQLGGPFLAPRHPPEVHMIPSPAPIGHNAPHASNGSRPDLGILSAVSKQMTRSGVGRVKGSIRDTFCRKRSLGSATPSKSYIAHICLEWVLVSRKSAIIKKRSLSLIPGQNPNSPAL